MSREVETFKVDWNDDRVPGLSLMNDGESMIGSSTIPHGNVQRSHKPGESLISTGGSLSAQRESYSNSLSNREPGLSLMNDGGSMIGSSNISHGNVQRSHTPGESLISTGESLSAPKGERYSSTYSNREPGLSLMNDGGSMIGSSTIPHGNVQRSHKPGESLIFTGESLSAQREGYSNTRSNREQGLSLVNDGGSMIGSSNIPHGNVQRSHTPGESLISTSESLSAPKEERYSSTHSNREPDAPKNPSSTLQTSPTMTADTDKTSSECADDSKHPDESCRRKGLFCTAL